MPWDFILCIIVTLMLGFRSGLLWEKDSSRRRKL